MKQFSTAARRGVSAVNNPVDIEFQFEATEGNYVTMTAHPPTTGQMALFFAHQLDAGTGSIRAMFDLLSDVLEPADYRIIERQLRTGVDVAVIIEIVRYLVEEWSARPTMSPPDSSTSPRRTGRSSTAKRLTTVSTSSNSQ